jgi:hypothetical protein
MNLHIVRGSLELEGAGPSASVFTIPSALKDTSITISASNTDVFAYGPGNKTPVRVYFKPPLRFTGGIIHVIETVLLPDLSKVVGTVILTPYLPAATTLPVTTIESKPKATNSISSSASSIFVSLLGQIADTFLL